MYCAFTSGGAGMSLSLFRRGGLSKPLGMGSVRRLLRWRLMFDYQRFASYSSEFQIPVLYTTQYQRIILFIYKSIDFF
jgi:hypothetical protein